MTQFSVNTHRFSPYKAYRFQVLWDGRIVAGVSKIGALKRTTEVISWRAGNEAPAPRKLPGRTVHAPVTLERGVTHDIDFEQWANKVYAYGRGQGSQMSLADYRKDIVLNLMNEAGQLVMSYRLYRCWVSEYIALPTLDGNAAAVAIESMTLETEGWERDTGVVEPSEPSFDQPEA